jgi:outer membrane protein TolC
VKKRIELAFYSALAAQKLADVAVENLKTLQENIEQIRHRHENGVATEYDVLRVDVQLSHAKTEVERTTDNVMIERKKLAQAMGRALDERTLIGEMPQPALVSKVEEMASPDLTDRQDFRAEELRKNAAHKQAQAAKGALVPAVGFKAHYESYDNADYPGEAYEGFRDAWDVGVFLKWTILDGGATIAKSQIAQAESEKRTHEYQEAILSLPADFELWKRRYVYSAHLLDANQYDLKRSKESFRIAESLFQQGRNTITDVLEAETDLFRARAGVVQSQLDAEEALIRLELTLGKEVAS